MTKHWTRKDVYISVIHYVSYFIPGNPTAVAPYLENCLAPIVVTIDPPATTATVTDQLDAMIASAVNAETINTNIPTSYVFPIGTTEFYVVLTDADGNSHTGCATSVTVQCKSYPLQVITNKLKKVKESVNGHSLVLASSVMIIN